MVYPGGGTEVIARRGRRVAPEDDDHVGWEGRGSNERMTSSNLASLVSISVMVWFCMWVMSSNVAGLGTAAFV